MCILDVYELVKSYFSVFYDILGFISNNEKE